MTVSRGDSVKSKLYKGSLRGRERGGGGGGAASLTRPACRLPRQSKARSFQGACHTSLKSCVHTSPPTLQATRSSTPTSAIVDGSSTSQQVQHCLTRLSESSPAFHAEGVHCPAACCWVATLLVFCCQPARMACVFRSARQVASRHWVAPRHIHQQVLDCRGAPSPHIQVCLRRQLLWMALCIVAHRAELFDVGLATGMSACLLYEFAHDICQLRMDGLAYRPNHAGHRMVCMFVNAGTTRLTAPSWHVSALPNRPWKAEAPAQGLSPLCVSHFGFVRGHQAGTCSLATCTQQTNFVTDVTCAEKLLVHNLCPVSQESALQVTGRARGPERVSGSNCSWKPLRPRPYA